MKIQFDQIAICPVNTVAAQKLLHDMGLVQWIHDSVTAGGQVFGLDSENTADLQFSYDAFVNAELEFELLHYKTGSNWMEHQPSCVSHFGVHCSEGELNSWKHFFSERKIPIAQEVFTESHTNPYLREKNRTYHYCIFDTRLILGVDIKFIVRLQEDL